MSLTREQALNELTLARADEVKQLDDSLRAAHLVGVIGDGQVGKTTLVSGLATNLMGLEPWKAVRVSFSEASSLGELTAQWARTIASTVMKQEALARLIYQPRRDWNTETVRELTRFAERFGDEVAYLLTEESKDPGLSAIAGLVRATALVPGSDEPLLVLDHLEAPALSFRHPVNVKEVLWPVRSVQQLGEFRTLLCCRTPASGLATGDDAAFYGDGRWIRIQSPSAAAFQQATGRSIEVVDEVLDFTGGHVNATIEVLMGVGRQRSVLEALQATSTSQKDLALRTLEYARSLHRLGGRLLQALAAGRGPYESERNENAKTVLSAVQSLHLAGLIRQPEEGRWQLVDPRVQWVLTGRVVSLHLSESMRTTLYRPFR